MTIFLAVIFLKAHIMSGAYLDMGFFSFLLYLLCTRPISVYVLVPKSSPCCPTSSCLAQNVSYVVDYR